jgi:hypothetical protein
VVAVLVLGLCPIARADNREEAGKEFTAGLAADEAKDYKNALEHYRRANELIEHYSTMFNIAVDLEKLGQLREAADWYRTYRDNLPASKAKEAAWADQHVVQLQLAPSRLTVQTSPAGARVLIDSKPVGVGPITRAVVGGDHRARAEMSGKSVELQVSLEFGEPKTIRLELPLSNDGPPMSSNDPYAQQPLQPTDPSTQRTAPVQMYPSGTASPTAGVLEVNGFPYQALVVVDEQVVGRVPGRFYVAAGPHTLRVSSMGYEPAQAQIQVRTRETTSFQAKLKPGDSSADPSVQGSGTSPQGAVGIGYMFGGSVGAEVKGAGFTGLFEFGIHGGRFDLATRLGKMGEYLIVDALVRFAVVPSRFTPVFMAGYSYTSHTVTDMTGLETSESGRGGVFGAGLRLDLTPKSSTAVFVTAGPELRTYSIGDSVFIPLMASLELTYGKSQ